MKVQTPVLLDRVGDAPAPPDYTSVTTEVEFLRLALQAEALVLRGERLCSWGRDFYKGRGVPCNELESPTREIQAILPTLSDDNAQDLYHRVGVEQFSQLDRPLRPLILLEAIYPNRLWRDAPSLSHGAEWLLWLHEQEPDSVIQTVFASTLQRWRNAASEPERRLYDAADVVQANELLSDWLQIADKPSMTELGTFPLSVPKNMIRFAKKEWSQRIIDSQGAFAPDLLKQQLIPYPLQQILAEESAAYYLNNNHQHLTSARYYQLARFLDAETQAKLLEYLPQPDPGELPSTVEDVVDWFEKAYLPYRLWQVRYGDEAAAAIAHQAARDFAQWYLVHYPKGLMGGPLHDHLSFYQTLISESNDEVATVVIVLDGLHAHDAQQFLRELEQEVPRLALLEQRYVFAPLPTVTTFAKDALLKGRDPSGAKGEVSLAPVLPERVDPTHQLAQAAPGDVLVWRVMEPDNTYHKRSSYDTLARIVQAALKGVVMTVADIVQNVPAGLRLRLIFTTDHGRLLDRATRLTPVPEGMKARGRAAWGQKLHEFDGSGVIIQDDTAYIHGERFGLPDEAAEAAVLIGTGMFKTNDNKSGSEAYPHGGASPEEVIVPWIVLERDWSAPDVPVRVSGRSTAGKKGSAKITLVNTGDIPITITQLTLQFSSTHIQAIDLERSIAARSSGDVAVELDSWPTVQQALELTATAILQLPAGQKFHVPVTCEFEVDDMYRRDDILGDLEL